VRWPTVGHCDDVWYTVTDGELAGQRWEPLGIDDVAERFDGAGCDWWIAGGVAIDCFLGWVTRPHADIDVEMFGRDRERIFDVFPGWDLRAVAEGRFVGFRPGAPLPDDVFAIWGRPSAHADWAVEILLAGGDGTTWRFRRDPTISLPRDRLVKLTPGGVPFCTPEVQLLYKAKHARSKDDADLARCLHRLDATQVAWLLAALRRLHPGHPWIAVLGCSPRVSIESG
jgi:Aminoglycoside-2''-adenylyltransferase